MNLTQYLDLNKKKMSRQKFIKLLKISSSRLWDIEKGKDIKLSVAYRIFEITEGNVNLADLYESLQKKD